MVGRAVKEVSVSTNHLTLGLTDYVDSINTSADKDAGLLLRLPLHSADIPFTCDPLHRGLTLSIEHLPTEHAFGTWVCMLDKSKSGCFMVKGAPALLSRSQKKHPWSSIMLSISNTACISLTIAADTAHSFSITTAKSLRVGEWTHLLYRINVGEGTVDLFMNGEKVTGTLPPIFKSLESSTYVNNSPVFLGQPPL